MQRGKEAEKRRELEKESKVNDEEWVMKGASEGGYVHILQK